MKLKVRIVKDDKSPLWLIRCAETCRPCAPTPDGTPPRSICFLGSSLEQAGAREMAERLDYEVVKP